MHTDIEMTSFFGSIKKNFVTINSYRIWGLEGLMFFTKNGYTHYIRRKLGLQLTRNLAPSIQG